MADKVEEAVAYELCATGLINGDVRLEDPMTMWILADPVDTDITLTHAEVLANNTVLGSLPLDSGIAIPKKGVEFDAVDGTPGVVYFSQGDYPIVYTAFEKLKDAEGGKVKIKFKKNAVLIVQADADTHKRINDWIVYVYIKDYVRTRLYP
jgi:hypothetical protein